MKCIRCGNDSNYPDRPKRVCPHCKGLFAFEPREGDPLSDGAWKAAIDAVGSNGTVRFCSSHLHHAVARRIKPKSPGEAIAIGVIGFLVTMIAAGAQLAGLAIAGVLMVLIAIVVAARPGAIRGLSLLRSDFDRLFARFCETHGKPRGLIEPRASARPITREMQAELEHYSFDRAVICDVPETVDVLLGNDFHFENNCAILTAGGYPEHAAPIIRTMLAQNPRLEVFVLHDATVEGCVLADMLRTDPAWFGGAERTAKVFDVALRPAQADKHKPLHWRRERARVDHPALSADESRWLSARTMALAAFVPEQIIKRLFRAMQHLPELIEHDTSGSSSDAVILWSTDASSSDGGGDSFG